MNESRGCLISADQSGGLYPQNKPAHLNVLSEREGVKSVEEVEVGRGGEKLEVLNFLEMWWGFFSFLFSFFHNDDMHGLASSPFLLFYFICMQICKRRERAVGAALRGY